MPTYEYACSACGNAWDQVQRITEPPVDVCPKCGKPEAHRLISRGAGFILKGGGWYSDLYSSPKAPAKSEGSTDGASAKPEGKSESKGDSKSESKSDGKSESKGDSKSESNGSSGSSSSGSSSSGSSSSSSASSTST